MKSKIIIALLALMVVLLGCMILFLILPPRVQPSVGGATAAPQFGGSVSVSFIANPASIGSGQCAFLVWSVAGAADSVQLDQQMVAPAGQMQVCPAQSETHMLEVRGHDGSIVSRQVSLIVQTAAPTQPPSNSVPTAPNVPTQPPPPPLTAVPTANPTPPPACAGAPVIQSFSANPATIAASQSSVLSWGRVDNATSAVIDQSIGGVATPGSITVKPGQTTTYRLTATGCGGTATKQVTITVGKYLPPPTLPTLQLRDLAVTQVGPVSLTRADKVYVDLKNTGNVDLDTNVHVVCIAMGRLRGNPSQQVPTGSDESIHITLSKGGTGFFWPSLVIDATIYSYDIVQCVVGLDGDPTPDDNRSGFNVP